MEQADHAWLNFLAQIDDRRDRVVTPADSLAVNLIGVLAVDDDQVSVLVELQNGRVIFSCGQVVFFQLIVVEGD